MKCIIILVQCILLFAGLIVALPFVRQQGVGNALTQEAPDGDEAVDDDSVPTTTNNSSNNNIQTAQEVVYYHGNPNPVPAPVGSCVPIVNDQGQSLVKDQFRVTGLCYFYNDRFCKEAKAPIPVPLPSGVDIPNLLNIGEYTVASYTCTNVKEPQLLKHITNPSKDGLTPERLVTALGPPQAPTAGA